MRKSSKEERFSFCNLFGGVTRFPWQRPCLRERQLEEEEEEAKSEETGLRRKEGNG